MHKRTFVQEFYTKFSAFTALQFHNLYERRMCPFSNCNSFFENPSTYKRSKSNKHAAAEFMKKKNKIIWHFAQVPDENSSNLTAAAGNKPEPSFCSVVFNRQLTPTTTLWFHRLQPSSVPVATSTRPGLSEQLLAKFDTDISGGNSFT